MLTNTTEIGTATLPRRRLTIPAPTDVSPSAPRRPPRFPALAQFASAARRVPRAPIPVAFALAVLAVLATVAPEPAAAQTTFISNTGQTESGSSQAVQAVAFTTGTGTYTLSSVGIGVGTQSISPTPVVKIYGDSGGNPGTTLVATMTNPGTLQESAVNSFTAPANTTLSASTTYWVVTSNSAATNGQGFWVGVTIKTLDTGTAVGWSLGNARFKSDIAATSWTPSNFALRFAIRGTSGTTTNNPPTVATAIPDQSATAGTAFSYAFPDTTFSDADTGDTLSYTATKADDTALPTWLAFAADTRTFSGTPQAADAGTVAVKVTASDGNGGSVSDTFDITVAADTTPPTLTSASVTGGGEHIEFQFSENIPFLNQPPGSAFTVTADGIAVTTPNSPTWAHPSTPDLLRLGVSSVIFQGQAVVVTYTDPTAGDDANAIQDTAGNDAATFTTGMNGVPAVTNNSVVTNTPATGAPTITGTAQVGQTLTAGTTAIMDANGLTSVSYTYQWIRTATGVDTNISGATASTYTLVAADLGTTVKVRVSFTDDASNDETLTSDATAAVSAAANTPATGAPTITGTAQVGQTLTATVGDIADVDGLPDPFLTDVNTSFQWIRVATDNTETNISMATASTYTLVAADLGTTVKVRVSFTDDASNAETLTSAATAAVSAAANTPATGAPTITGTAQVGQTLTAGTTAIMDANGLTSVSYTYQWIRTATGVDTNISGATASTYTLVAADLGTTIKVRVSFTDDASNAETLTSAATAAVSAAANTPATGAPTITGTAQVGQTLTAGTTAIMDAEGLTSVSYTYQWIRTVDTNISGATASTYTLVAADQGTTIKVRVSFTDDASNAETLTSAATAAVSAVVPSDWSLKPTAVAAGAKFRLLFLSSTKRNANATDIATYNTFVQTRAAAGHTDIQAYSAGFRVVGCTAAVDARDNTSTTYTATDKGVPIYWLNGAKAADQYEDFYDGSWDDEANDKNESGTNGLDTSLNDNWPLTGCDHDGTAEAALGASQVTVGRPNSSGSSHGPLNGNSQIASTVLTRPMYGLSAVFQVAGSAVTTVPGAPTGLTATASGATQIDLSWTAPASTGGSAITGYKIEVSANGTSGWTDQVADTNSTATTYAHTGLAAGDTRHYRVSAINTNGAGTASNVDSATTGTTAPGAPTGLTATASGTTQIDLSWSAPASTGGSAITGYKIEVSANGTSGWTDQVADTNSTATTYAHTGLAAGDTRHYRVSAINTNGAGTASNVDSATTGASVPGAPTGLTATASGATQIDLSWTAPGSTGGSAITGYKIEVSANGTSGWTDQVADTNSTATTYAHTGLAAGDTRHYRVSAINTNGAGTASNVANATTGATAPTLTSADVEITDALIINLVFSEDLQLSNPPAVSAFTVTVDGSAATVSSVGVPGSVLPQNELWLQLSTAIRQGQVVVVTYEDPTAGDDANAIQDTAGNDAATFTTGMDGVPAVTNNPTVTNTVPADWSLIPTGLTTGAKFRLLFLSSTPSAVSSTDIADYNTFIQTRAAAGHTDIRAYSAGFRVVGCSAAVDARDNTKTTYTTTDKGVPIYWLNGAKAADQYEDFYDGSWDDEANDKNESGTNGPDTSQAGNWPLTGCSHDGTEQWPLGASQVSVGRPNSSGSGHGPLFANAQITSGVSSLLYGLSAVFEVAAAVVVPNNPPAFSADTAARSVAENTAAGQNVGAALTATDADSDTLIYTLEGADAASFDIVSGSGQIRTRTGVTYNHEAKSTHTVVVKADDGNGGTDTVTVTITVTDVDEPPGQPAAPSVSATAGSTTSLDVTWTAPTNTGPAIASYDLQYRAGTSGNFTNGPQNVTGTSAAIGSLAADTSYEVQVRATNAEGDGDWSVAGTGRTTATSAPGAPTGLSATASGATAINLSWSAPGRTGGSAITGYKIEVSANGTSNWTDQVADTNSTATTYAHTGLAAGDTRHYRVSAINTNGAGTASNVDSATTGTSVPGAPTGLTATASGATAINLSWSAPGSTGGSAITGYKIEVSANGTSNWTDQVADTNSTATTYAHTGLAAGDTRHYRVSAINANGAGTASNVASATTGTTVPGAPTGLTATASGTTAINLSWSAPASTGGSAITGYKIEVSSNGTSSWTNLVANTSNTTTTYAHTGLTAGTTRHYRVSAINTNGTGTASNVANATTDATAPGAPTGLTATASGTTAINLSWSAPGSTGGSAITGYRIEVSPNGTSGWTDQVANTNSTATTYAHTGLGGGTTRHYRVSAINTNGAGTASNVANATTGQTTVTFGASSYTAAEGGATATVAVRLSAAASATVTIPLTKTHRGGATAADYSGVPSNVTFTAGQTRRTFTVTATDDADTDGGESVQLGFGTLPGGYAPGARRTATVTLVDDDATLIVNFGTERHTTVKVRESDTVWHRFIFSLSTSRYGPPNGNPQQPVTIPLVVTHRGGATPADYEVRGRRTLTSVTFGVGESVTSFSMRAIPDGRRETGEGLRLDFGPLPAGVRAGTWGPYETIEFVDQELPRVTASFGAESYTATEGGAPARVSIHLSEPVEIEPLVVRLVVTHVGATAADYTGIPKSVRFEVGEQTQTITVKATDDTDDDDGESVTLSFVNDPNGRVRVRTGPASATVALADNDGPRRVTVSFGAVTYTATEGGADATVRVELDAAPGRSVTVPLTKAHLGNATAADYSGIPMNVTFAANQTSRTFAVMATAGDGSDGGESVSIGFGTLPEGVFAGSPAATTVTLADGSEQRLVVNFGSSRGHTVQVREGARRLRLNVLLDSSPRRPLTIPLVVTHVGGATAADYAAIPESVTFAAGQTSAHYYVRALPDEEDETGEGLQLDFGPLPPGVRKGTWGPYETIDFLDPAPAAHLSVSGTVVTVGFPGALDGGSTPSPRDFVVSVEAPGGEKAMAPVAAVAVEGSDVFLQLARPVAPDDTVTLSYLADAMHPIRDEAGSPAAPLTDAPVRNQTPASGLGPEAGLRVQAGCAAEKDRVPKRRTVMATCGLAGGTQMANPAPLAALLEAAQVGAGTGRLDLSSRHLTDITALAGLTGLRELDLRDNAIEDLWPLAGLRGLEALYLSGNQISDLRPLAGLRGLKVLDLAGNRIEDLWPLSGLTELRELDLADNAVADLGPLAGLAGLEALDLAGNRISDVWGPGYLTRLERLNLADNAIEDLRPLARLTLLEVLLLDRNRITDVLALSPMAELANLGLAGNPIANLWPLEGLGQLHRLDLSGNAAADPSALGRVENLRWLWLDPAPAAELEAAPGRSEGRGAAPLWTEPGARRSGPAHRALVEPDSGPRIIVVEQRGGIFRNPLPSDADRKFEWNGGPQAY